MQIFDIEENTESESNTKQKGGCGGEIVCVTPTIKGRQCESSQDNRLVVTETHHPLKAPGMHLLPIMIYTNSAPHSRILKMSMNILHFNNFLALFH